MVVWVGIFVLYTCGMYLVIDIEECGVLCVVQLTLTVDLYMYIVIERASVQLRFQIYIYIYRYVCVRQKYSPALLIT